MIGLLAYFAIVLVVGLAVLAPLIVGRWLSERDRALEDAEVAAIEAQALALLAGSEAEAA
jgi:hypothetical protein